jgi:soluble lytic murein transglycosylase-like protein
MCHRVVQAISILILFVVTTMAQTGRQPDASLQARARQLEPFIIESARRYGVDPRILRTMCFIESRYRVDAVSPKGAVGPMQFMPETASRYGLRNPHDPREAIDAAARYMRDLLNKFDGRVDLALAAYNAGEGTVESFRTGRSLVLRTGKVINPRGIVTGGIPPYGETQAYVRFAIALFMNEQSSERSSVDVVSRASKSGVSNGDKTSSLNLQNVTRSASSSAPKKVGSSFIEIQ